jgi:hypothetical protein
MGESGRQEQATPPAAEGSVKTKPSPSNDDARKPHRSRRNRGRNNKQQWKDSSSNTPVHVPKEKFVGRSEDLKGFTYDVITSKGGVACTRTTEEIARYVSKKYTTTGAYIRTAILTLNLPATIRPTTVPVERSAPRHP